MINAIKARIVSNPLIMGGEPTIEGTRVPAENICLEWEKSGKKLND